MLVDNAIVVVENIYRHMEEGKSAKQAALEGTNEVSLGCGCLDGHDSGRVFSLVFWGGIMGEFMGYLPKTLIIVLFSSLVVAISILPSSRRNLRAPGRRCRSPRMGSVNWCLVDPLQSRLEWSIDHRYRAALAGFGALFFTFFCYGALNHGTEFFPIPSLIAPLSCAGI